MQERFSVRHPKVGTSILSLSLFISQVSHAGATSALPNLQLSWPEVEGCPDRQQVERAIAQHLGAAVAHTGPVVASVTIEPAAGYRLILFTRSQSGQSVRALHEQDCQHVTDAAVVILAMLLAGDGLEATPANAVPVEGTPLGPQLTPRRAEASRIALGLREFSLRSVEVPRESSWRAGLGVWLPLGISKAAWIGAALVGEVDIGGWRAVARIGWIPETRIGSPSDPSRGADVTMLSGALGIGPVIAHGSWAFVPRFGIAERLLVGKGYGVDLPESRWAYFASGSVGESLELRIAAPLFLQSYIEVSVPFERPALLLEPGGEVLRPARLGLDTGVALMLRF